MAALYSDYIILAVVFDCVGARLLDGAAAVVAVALSCSGLCAQRFVGDVTRRRPGGSDAPRLGGSAAGIMGDSVGGSVGGSGGG